MSDQANKALSMRQDKHAQRMRILEALRLSPKTTYDLRRMGIFQAPTRVFELRAMGYPILTSRVRVIDQGGYAHNGVALYQLDGQS